MNILLQASAAAVLAASLTVPATAASDGAHARLIATVNVDGLDLSTPEGRFALEKRIDKASRRYCAVDGNGQVPSRKDEKACRAKAHAALVSHFVAAA
ncbi:hypothetical protein A6F68_00504 [Tsuneonella dongtanensis]|uniref:UrcA family protein n=1 Tax=Tsuneonella dongtanensis TaxID=692370 RepID=A0A1B2AA50_9SPHN|nr:UrcA family protein [Tsuneonella dongtanensis]ANY19039.1 hypothetical protein A6F68_00504 [Tsuneonella dongtanensis]